MVYAVGTPACLLWRCPAPLGLGPTQPMAGVPLYPRVQAGCLCQAESSDWVTAGPARGAGPGCAPPCGVPPQCGALPGVVPYLDVV